MSKYQIAHNMKIQGFLPLLAGLASQALPFLTGTVSPALDLASTGVQKLVCISRRVDVYWPNSITRTSPRLPRDVHDFPETSPRQVGDVSGKSRTCRRLVRDFSETSTTSPRRPRLPRNFTETSRGSLGQV